MAYVSVGKLEENPDWIWTRRQLPLPLRSHTRTAHGVERTTEPKPKAGWMDVEEKKRVRVCERVMRKPRVRFTRFLICPPCKSGCRPSVCGADSRSVPGVQMADGGSVHGVLNDSSPAASASEKDTEAGGGSNTGLIVGVI